MGSKNDMDQENLLEPKNCGIPKSYRGTIIGVEGVVRKLKNHSDCHSKFHNQMQDM